MAFPFKAAVAASAFAATVGGCSRFPGYQVTDERECMARVMYFESNRSSEDGMLAVGTVVMNRLQSPKYPKTICGVVGQRNQFAEGTLSKPVGGSSYARALRVADAVLTGQRHERVGGAMFFHTAGYTFPYRNMAYVAAAGGNVFYEKRTPGTFDPIHPATLVAEAEGARQTQVAPPSRTRLAARSEEEDEDGPVEPPRRPATGQLPTRRAGAAYEEPPRPTRRAEPLVLADVGSRPPVRADRGPPTIAELIELDLKRP